MNRLFNFLFVVFFCFSLSADAQKKFTEGIIAYDIIINTGTQKPQAADFFDGAISTVYLKGQKSRTEMVSSLGTQSTIIDGTSNTIAILKEYGEQRYIIQLTPANWRDANKRYENITFSYSDESKTILGYKCNKAVGKLTDGTTFTVWFTPDLVLENKDFQYANRSLPGLALEYESTFGNLKVTYTASKINITTVPASRFDLPKSGYRVMTYEESKGGN